MEITCGDDRAGDLTFIGQRGQVRTPALPPQPEAVDRLQTGFTTSLVDGVGAQYDQRCLHQLAKNVRAVPCGQIVANRPAHSLMGIDAAGPRLSADPDHEMPMSGAGIKL